MAQQPGKNASAASFQLSVSYLVKKNIGGVPQLIRGLTVLVYERAVESAIWRGLLGRGDVGDAWTVLSALFASVFDDHTIGWLNKRGYLRWEQRGQAEAIIAAVNTLIGRHPLRHANFEIGPSHVESFPIGLPLLGVKLTYGRHRKSDAVDPKPTLLWHASKCIVFWQRYQRDAAMHNAPQTFTIQNANRILAEWSKIFGHANAAAVLDDEKPIFC
jgi:hypothetical protein